MLKGTYSFVVEISIKFENEIRKIWFEMIFDKSKLSAECVQEGSKCKHDYVL